MRKTAHSLQLELKSGVCQEVQFSSIVEVAEAKESLATVADVIA